MSTHYTKKKQLENKKSHGGVWVVFVALGIFAVIIFRVASSGTSAMHMFDGMPTSDGVYDVAKEFVRPTLRSDDAVFSDEGYQFADKGDSIYVIKSYAETPTGSGDGTRTKEFFKIILKYKGGTVSRKSNWEVLDLRSN
ncbi:hypothetical protein DJ568_04285 [Mucilaginibacter hurinus]|uniref:Uncharacterized protein n=1 Tax=Mucilaginibacter hurinus TaxID=2201324 RepID=A0A367GT01_9SPHI|nr:hypothetical protein [Mucilaginibacter hurinus]RCH55976.1 hypothetical protein DJ568_04285 [Mucilaginibacter hurinus]